MGWSALMALLILGGVSLLPKFPQENTNANSVGVMRDQQATLDKKLLELQPTYSQNLQKFQAAQKKMTELEAQGKSLREEREHLESSIRELTDGKKE